jgi:hypothetical protein
MARGWNCIYMLNMDHVGAIRYPHSYIEYDNIYGQEWERQRREREGEESRGKQI